MNIVLRQLSLSYTPRTTGRMNIVLRQLSLSYTPRTAGRMTRAEQCGLALS
jgi:hypothetical protein